MTVKSLVLILATAQASLFGQPAGKWEGALAGRLRLVLEIDGKGAVLTSVDQGNAKLPVDSYRWEGDVLDFQIVRYSISFEGKLNSADESIAGTFIQGPTKLPLTFRRPSAPPKPTLTAAKRGDVTLEPCWAIVGRVEALCGGYDVWENRKTKTGRKIRLNIMVLPAKSATPRPDPFVAIAGGPGQSAVEAYPTMPVLGPIRESRDVVLVDQRGTGKSNPLPCPLTDLARPKTILDPLFPIDIVKQCRADLERKADLTQYTTEIAADDLDEVRRAMSYQTLNLFGGSYGTRVVLVYLRRHFEFVRTATMKGVAATDYKMGVTIARALQDSIEALFADCAADARCSAAYPDLRGDFAKALERLDKQPAVIDVAGPNGGVEHAELTRPMFVDHLRQLLYIPTTASMTPSLIHASAAGDFNRYAALVIAVAQQIGDQVARGMFLSVTCAEDLPTTTAADVKRLAAGTALGDFRYQRHKAACDEWPRGQVGKNFAEPVVSDKPVLIISGDEDPATPSSLAAKAAATLRNARHVTVRYGTHLTQSSCLDKLVVDFVAAGTAKDLDAGCAAEIRRPPFVVKQ